MSALEYVLIWKVRTFVSFMLWQGTVSSQNVCVPPHPRPSHARLWKQIHTDHVPFPCFWEHKWYTHFPGICPYFIFTAVRLNRDEGLGTSLMTERTVVCRSYFTMIIVQQFYRSNLGNKVHPVQGSHKTNGRNWPYFFKVRFREDLGTPFSLHSQTKFLFSRFVQNHLAYRPFLSVYM